MNSPQSKTINRLIILQTGDNWGEDEVLAICEPDIFVGEPPPEKYVGVADQRR
jgi:hypothetical protein